YTVTLTTYDILGCVSQTSFNLEEVSYYRILMPKAFKPNSDVLNDTFFLKISDLEVLEMHIFNKCGNMVYCSFSIYDSGWDGRLRGKLSPNGNYVYKIQYTSMEGERGSKTGVFTLVF